MVNTVTAKPSAYKIALNYLARREHSIFELTKKLAHKVYDNRFGSKLIENVTEQQKRQQCLYQHGFDMALIKQVVR